MHSADYRVVWPDGTVRRLHSTGRVNARKAGRPVTVCGLTMDITDRAEQPS